jgi:hypothetical protein
VGAKIEEHIAWECLNKPARSSSSDALISRKIMFMNEKEAVFVFAKR